MPFRIRYLGDTENQPFYLEENLKLIADEEFGGIDVDFDSIVSPTPEQVRHEFLRLTDGDPRWMAFDVLVLDVRYNSVDRAASTHNPDFAGLSLVHDGIVDELKERSRTSGEISIKLPWDHLFLCTVWMDTTSDPRHQQCIEAAIGRKIRVSNIFAPGVGLDGPKKLARAILKVHG